MCIRTKGLATVCVCALVCANLGVQAAQVDPAVAEHHFNQGHELHVAGNADASASALAAAIGHYTAALDSMGGAHAATQYYLGTAQLDAGLFAEGVANVAAALHAEPDNFGPEAVQRLRAGRQSVDMSSHKRPVCDDAAIEQRFRPVEGEAQAGGGAGGGGEDQK